MKIIRKIVLFFTSATFIGLLFLTAFAWTVNHTVARRETVKAWLSESGAYEHFVDEVARVAKKKQTTQTAHPSDGDVSNLDIDTVKVAAEKAFPPSVLRSNLEGVLDGTYDWLDGKKPSLEFTIDLTAAKKSFAEELGNVALAKSINLPACTSAQLSQDFDPFSATCIPKGLNINAEVQKFVNDFQNNKDLPDSTINADLIQVEKDGKKQRIDQAYSGIPKYYRLGKGSAWLLTFLSLFWALLIVLLSATRRFGIKHITKSLLLVALTLTTTALILRPLTNKLNDSFLKSRSDTSSFSQQIVVPLVQKINDTSREWGLIFAAIYGLIGLTLVILLLATRKHKHLGEPHSDDTGHTEADRSVNNNLHPESVQAHRGTTAPVQPRGAPEIISREQRPDGKSVQG